jgi:hypothetical protein
MNSRPVGVINVGKDQSGFDFVCSPGDHNIESLAILCQVHAPERLCSRRVRPSIWVSLRHPPDHLTAAWPKSSPLFDVTKNRFDDLFPHLVEGFTALRLQLVSHLL